jgi:phosphatidate cytidylyltransferase
MALSNNSIRILVAVLTIPLILLVSYLGGYFFFIFVLGIALLSFFELHQIALKKRIFTNLILGLAAVCIILINKLHPFADDYSLVLLFTVILTAVELFRNKGSAITNLGTTFLGIFYIGFFAGSLILVREFYPPVDGLYIRGGLIIISIFASIWVCDSAAYWGGTSFGKHKLYPRVSPSKSWEGAVFGFIFAIITMICAKLIILDFLSWQTIISFGIIVGLFGQIGDLIESLIKRDAGVKDSSNYIPGHGGIFDRFDSLLYSAPFVYLYLKYFGT